MKAKIFGNFQYIAYRVAYVRRIGIAASGSTVLGVGVILAEGEERNVYLVKKWKSNFVHDTKLN